tara:strand:- start:1118 stop:1999 length:882 start_codon:yes stop_codon:yes gene_type:complete
MNKRINKVIALLEAGQPVYSTSAKELTYNTGKLMSQTWADLIVVDFEHHAFDILGLTQFMKGLKDGGPTPDGYLMPTVVSTLPSNCMSKEEILYNAWQTRHVLSTGAHGVLQTHTRDVEAVKTFVATARYPYQKLGSEFLPEGLRGSGGQKQPSEIWGITQREYTDLADPWPLNPKGEILLGLKIEDRYCVDNAEKIAAVPGIGFAEWGPGDMGMSYGDPDAHDPPYPEFMNEAREKVRAALDKSNVAFYSSWNDKKLTIKERVDHLIDNVGAKILAGLSKDYADYGRIKTGL